MTIKKYYLKLSQISLKYSLILSIISLIGTLVILKMDKPFLLLIIPFVWMSFLYFFVHIFYWVKSMKSLIEEDHPSTQSLLLNKLDDKFFCFTPGGKNFLTIETKIRDLERMQFHINYVQYWKENWYEVNLRNLTIDNLEGKRIGKMMVTHKKRMSIECLLQYYGNTYLVKWKKNKFFIYSNDFRTKLAYLEKGWMPFSWSRRFLPNTPILTFHEQVTPMEKEIFFIVYVYFSHIQEYMKIKSFTF